MTIIELEEWQRAQRRKVTDYRVREIDTPHIEVAGSEQGIMMILDVMDDFWSMDGVSGQAVIYESFPEVAYDTESGTFLDEQD